MRAISVSLAALVVMSASDGLAQEATQGRLFNVDRETSWLRVLAYPDGPLRRFGHHHVISHHGISGTVVVASDPVESTLTLELAAGDLQVDDPELRKLEGEDFEKEVSQKDMDGTKANMLGDKLLNAAAYPTIQVRSQSLKGSLPNLELVATVSVAGTDSTVTFPVNVELTEDSFVARGEREVLHGELGLSPFKAAGGALSVRDSLVFKYEISGALAQAEDGEAR